MGALIFANWVTDSQENLWPFEKVQNSFDWCKERLKRWIANRRIPARAIQAGETLTVV
ncbi:MAG: hypothetical protein RH981_10205 [Arenibacter sp.]